MKCARLDRTSVKRTDVEKNEQQLFEFKVKMTDNTSVSCFCANQAFKMYYQFYKIRLYNKVTKWELVKP